MTFWGKCGIMRGYDARNAGKFGLLEGFMSYHLEKRLFDEAKYLIDKAGVPIGNTGKVVFGKHLGNVEVTHDGEIVKMSFHLIRSRLSNGDFAYDLMFGWGDEVVIYSETKATLIGEVTTEQIGEFVRFVERVKNEEYVITRNNN